MTLDHANAYIYISNTYTMKCVSKLHTLNCDIILSGAHIILQMACIIQCIYYAIHILYTGILMHFYSCTYKELQAKQQFVCLFCLQRTVNKPLLGKVGLEELGLTSS